MKKSNRAFQFKLCILGDKTVGKTSFFNYFIPQDKRQRSSILQTHHGSQVLDAFDLQVNVQLWDWSRQFSRKELYFRDMKGMIMIFDVMNKSTLNVLSDMMDNAARILDKRIECILVGNKSDLRTQSSPGLSQNAIKAWISSSDNTRFNIKYVESSFSKGIRVNEIIESLIPELLPFEKRCYNCYSTYDHVILKSGYYFCRSCISKADLIKAEAFARVNK